ncbi:nucleotide pyrophosphohydrolase, partial [Modestobacter sp. VKM Ac-2676]
MVTVMDRLRSPGGCPWDAEQTHASLRGYLLEEAHEAYDAIVEEDPVAMREELGDVLLQVAFHARVAAEAPEGRRFDVDDVAAELVDKLVRRHPHVFADAGPRDVAAVERGWDEIKQAEKQRRSPTEGVSRSQPATSWGGGA